uniref:Uncharacterized protein n=2 Tax=Caenorhabditis japonica TaxID=281687 RepID=A0A8R1DI34_CAEJA
MERLKNITFIPMTSAQNKELHFFPLFKGVGGEYNYDSLPSCDTVKLAKGVNTTKVWREMNGCGFALLRRFFGNPEAVLPNFVNTVYVCDDVAEMNGYEVKELKNSERSYYSVLPKCRDSENTFVNFGISQNTSAEEQLKKTIPNLKMFGTSPTGINSSISSIYDHVFPGSVSNEASAVTSLENYLNAELKNPKTIDIIWINLSQGPFTLHKSVQKGGIFNSLNLTVCQIGVEARVDDHRNFYSFMLEVLNNWTFLFLRPKFSDDKQFVRVTIVNAANEWCYKKYYL